MEPRSPGRKSYRRAMAGGAGGGVCEVIMDAAGKEGSPLPIDHGTVVFVVALGAAPLVADLLRHGVVVQFDAQTGAGRHVHEPFLEDEWPFEVAFAQRAVLLAEEVRDR